MCFFTFTLKAKPHNVFASQSLQKDSLEAFQPFVNAPLEVIQDSSAQVKFSKVKQALNLFAYHPDVHPVAVTSAHCS